ncbi:MAG: hypothetical protein K2X66_10085 [Cyanobacteria bacterium]|nr:hypothetical protein [Cyanobacteriota bacterium]
MAGTVNNYFLGSNIYGNVPTMIGTQPQQSINPTGYSFPDLSGLQSSLQQLQSGLSSIQGSLSSLLSQLPGVMNSYNPYGQQLQLSNPYGMQQLSPYSNQPSVQQSVGYSLPTPPPVTSYSNGSTQINPYSIAPQNVVNNYNGPVNQFYNQAPSYSAPVSPYQAPQSYIAPSTSTSYQQTSSTYTQPVSTYQAPQSYIAPSTSTSYQQTSSTYTQPVSPYQAPQTYSAPTYSPAPVVVNNTNNNTVSY